MQETFKFLRCNSQGEAVEDKYSLETLKNHFVVRDEYNNLFRVFSNRDDFWEWEAAQPFEQKCFHEVVFGFLPQRLKFDIDFPVNKSYSDDNDNVNDDDSVYDDDNVYDILDMIINVIIDVFYETYSLPYNINLTREQILLTDSIGLNKKRELKYSFHIILYTYSVLNNNEAKAFTSKVLENLPKHVYPFVDPQVNKSIQNFRIIGSHKKGSMRVKMFNEELAEVFETSTTTKKSDTLIATPFETTCLPCIFTNVKETTPSSCDTIQQSELEEVLKFAGTLCKNHCFLRVHKNLVLFKRTSPSYCEICKRMHDKDNTLILRVTGNKVYQHCRHDNKHSLLMGSLSGTTNFVETYVDQVMTKSIEVHESILFEELPDTQKHIYDESSMREYERVPTLVVKAQMKIGKTVQLRNYLQKYYGNNSISKQQTIRFVTFRQIFSKNIQSRLPNFTLYSEVTGDLDSYERVIVQVESLFRLTSTAEPVDLLILDEVESIFNQFNSGLHKYFAPSFAIFMWMLETANYVICLDANLGNRTYNILQRFRGDVPIFFHWNQYKRAQHDTYYFTSSRETWLNNLLKDLLEDKKIVIPTNSLMEARLLQSFIQKKFPEKKIGFYSSKSTAHERESHFNNVSYYWGLVDILIYTPTISAGVSYEDKRFDVLYGFFNNMSCDVETCCQMLGRVRELKSKCYKICLQGKQNYYPETIEDIEMFTLQKRDTLFQTINNHQLSFTYSKETGRPVYYKTPYYHLWLETMRIQHLSKNHFITRFINQVADTGAKVFILTGEKLETVKQYTSIKMEIKHQDYVNIASAETIDANKALQIKQNLKEGITVDQQDLFAYEKYKLLEFYAWHGHKITPKFVEQYNSFMTKQNYTGRVQISRGKTVYESLTMLQTQELNFHQWAMQHAEHHDLQFNYSFQSHMYAIMLLTKCGFKCVQDPNILTNEQLMTKLVDEFVQYDLSAVSFEFKLKKPSKTDPQTILKFINKVLGLRYGLKIHHNKGNYYIKNTKAGSLIPFVRQQIKQSPCVVSNLLPITETSSVKEETLTETSPIKETFTET
ncbi:replication [African swine fever virus]|uniref:Putative helicase/primase complex protein n=2 Tax=African swine fever virus TaxID=10497 RepID=A9JLQ2_ASFPP|nr:replication [African swine fever virus]YP_009703655.1 replication [African swine fever virus OURT 88/3]AIY22397.1 helicase [African swine fever virus]UEN73057.1 F1055L [African swine fever virus]UEN73215.1 F1055L [African swine fever virus]WFS78160.1 F1055L [African swine fever virus]WFS78332.1 F1055L [African swine fever virus]